MNIHVQACGWTHVLDSTGCVPSERVRYITLLSIALLDCSTRVCIIDVISADTALGMNHEDPSVICNKWRYMSVHFDKPTPKGSAPRSLLLHLCLFLYLE